MNRVAVIGAGTMGASIALAVAKAGIDVQLVEPDPAVRERAIARIAKDAQRLRAEDAPGRVAMLSSIRDLSSCDLAIEAVPESISLKHEIFTALEGALPNAVLATNTSSLSVAEIAEAVESPARVLGIHFFNPATLMQLVEIVAPPQTSSEALALAHAFATAIGKTAVDAADTPGFIVNRVARPYYLQSLRALERGVASAEELDALACGAGFRMGPFALMDLIGLDVNLATSDSVYERLDAPRLEPSQLQRALVLEGKLGRKSGAGFYTYEGGALPPKPDTSAPPRPPFNQDERVVVAGVGEMGDVLAELLAQSYAHVRRLEYDDDDPDVLDEATIVFDFESGWENADRLVEYSQRCGPQTVIFVDAYTSRMETLAARVRNPERFVGYGILGSFDTQQIVEIVDADATGDDALGLAEEVFAALGKRVQLVADVPGLYLGRTIASIVNEAVYVVQEQVATADDVDVAMRLGTNYPIGPIAWGREIGAARIIRILTDVANEDGPDCAPARAIWVLDAADEEEQMQQVSS